MRQLTLGFFIGIMAIYWPVSWQWLCRWLAVIAFLAGGGGFVVSYFFPSIRGSRSWFIGLLAIAIGFLRLMVAVFSMSVQQLPHRYQGKEQKLTGYIASIPKWHDHHLDFLLAMSRQAKKRFKVNLIRVSWYRPKKLWLRPGDQWQLFVRLRRPDHFYNKGQFDYEKWLFSRHINAVAYVVSRTRPSKGGYNQLISSKWYHDPLLRLRAKIATLIDHGFKNQPLRELMIALTIGDRTGLNKKEWQVFQRTGTAHLMAISGLHVGFITSLVFWLVTMCWRRSALLNDWLPAKVASAWAAIVVVILYGLLTGFALPTKRALIMIVMYLIAIIRFRKVNSRNLLLMALFLVLLMDPLVVLTMSFYLSFLTVFIILYSLPKKQLPKSFNQLTRYQTWTKQLFAWFTLQWLLFLGLLPLSLFFFQQTSLIAPLVNLFAIPWVGFVILPLCFIAILLLPISLTIAHPLWWLALKNLQALWWLLTLLASQGFSFWHYRLSLITLLFLIMVVVSVVFIPLRLFYRCLACLILLPLFFFSRRQLPLNQVTVTLLDVRKGLVGVIKTAHHRLVYVSNPKASLKYHLNGQVLWPFLQRLKIDHIDTLVLARLNERYINSWLLNSPVSVWQMITPTKSIKSLSPPVLVYNKPQKWHWDGVDFNLVPVTISKKQHDFLLKITVGTHHVWLLNHLPKLSLLSKLMRDDVSQKTILLSSYHNYRHDRRSFLTLIDKVRPKSVLLAVDYYDRSHFSPLPIHWFTTISGALTVFLSNRSFFIQHPEDKLWFFH